MTLREQYFAELYRSYFSLTPEQLGALNEDAPFELSEDAVWPANGEVLRICPHDDAVAALPCLAVVAAEGKTKHPHLLKMEVFVRLQIQSQIAPENEGDDVAGTAMETAQAWLQAVTEALHDTETFRSHLLSLSEAERTGGHILMRVVADGVAHQHNAEDRVHTWELIINHHVDVSPAD